METSKLKEDYSNLTIDEMDSLWIKTKSPYTDTTPGIPGNPNYTFATGTEADYMAKGGNMKVLQEAAPTGTQTQQDDYRDSRVAYLKSAGVLAKQANLQTPGNEPFLKSTGLTLNLGHADAGQMDQPVIISANPTVGVAGQVVVSFKKSTKYCHGTWYNITDVATGITTQGYSHSLSKIILTGLTPQKQYSIVLAYDGTNPLKVWSAPKTFWAQ